MQSITHDQIKSFRAAFDADPTAKLVQNAAITTVNKDLALNNAVVKSTELSAFSTQLDEWSVTNQKSSGRCWLFALLNLCRVGAMKKLNVKDFEFSQSYIHFWDKFERANHMLEAMIELSGRPVDDRTIGYLLQDPIGDGGQWAMAINILNKHGIVPKTVFPESFSSSATLQMNAILKDLLRSTACELRGMKDSGKSLAELRQRKEERMQDVWRILCIHLGTPPESFEWQWTDKDKKYTNKGMMTPKEFAAEYITIPVNDYVCLVNDPRNPYMKTYSVDYLQSVADGPRVVYLNVDTETMKSIASRQLQDGLPVWMGCDVGKQMDRKLGIWDANLFEMESLYGVKWGMDKAQRLVYGQTLMTHAMLFTGVSVSPVDGKPVRWRVENSWGDANAKKGFYTMNDNWFAEYMFEIAAPSSYLSEEMKAAVMVEPVVLPAWDPMGALARSEFRNNTASDADSDL